MLQTLNTLAGVQQHPLLPRDDALHLPRRCPRLRTHPLPENQVCQPGGEKDEFRKFCKEISRGNLLPGTTY